MFDLENYLISNIAVESEAYETKINKSQVLSLLSKFKYPKSQYVISYKAALVLHGVVNECNDIDILVTEKLGKQLIKEGFESMRAPLGGIKIVINDRLECFIVDSFPEFETINSHHCETIDSLILTYKNRGRPKDLETLKRINEFIKK